jgi:ubiquinone biosynthesis accessory factor UbiJ
VNGPRPVTAMLNHVLRATPVAMDRLRPYAGRTAAFHVGPLTFAWTVQTTGEVTAAVPGAARDLEVRLSPFLLPRLALHDEAALREVEMKGDAELAQEVSFLARHLRWDAEEDLSKVVGDVAAHRAAGAASATAHWAGEAVKRTAAGAAEYWTEEAPLIASRVKVEDFTRGVSELRDAVERLEKRIDKIGVGSGSES